MVNSRKHLQTQLGRMDGATTALIDEIIHERDALAQAVQQHEHNIQNLKQQLRACELLRGYDADDLM